MVQKQCLILRFSAPLLAFGGVLVDEYGPVKAFPAKSMVVGLLGNALGYDHSEWAKLQALQRRLCMAVRCDLQGEKIRDYQTIDFDQPFLQETGWRPCGSPLKRSGGSGTKDGTHIRHREYWAGASYTLAVALLDSENSPCIDTLAKSVQRPKRPLFIGRKGCIPSDFLFQGMIIADSPFDALRQAPLDPRATGQKGFIQLWSEIEREGQADVDTLAVTDERDWQNQIHTGKRFLRRHSVCVADFPEVRHAS